MSETESVTVVRILGEEYRIRGASSERITALAGYVDAKFQELEGSGQGLDLKKQSVLVALNIAEEIFEERGRSAEFFSSLDERLKKSRRRLEFALGDEAGQD